MVDKYENKGKRSGAYSWGAYGCHPFVSMNYNGTVDSMFTLIHEMVTLCTLTILGQLSL